MAYKIESRVLGGWSDAGWLIDDAPWRFATPAEGQQAINDFIADTAGEHRAADYRVAPDVDQSSPV